MYPKSDLLEALSINTWFAALPLAERKAMVRAGEVTTFRAGEMLYRKGDAGASFVGLVEGPSRCPRWARMVAKPSWP